METKVRTDFLFARPSFFNGMARAIDFGGTMNEYNGSATPEIADARAIASDWRMVGEDIFHAINQYGKIKRDE